jgi:dTDP-4-amino-4,6-dideoxygalactose transaminase
MTTAPAPARAVPFFNYQGAFASRLDEFMNVVRDVVSRGAFIQQRDLIDFETHLADYLGVRHAIGVGNATDGLIMAFRAAGVGPGDEVIFPSHTMVASPAAAAHVGATPVPVDCGDDHLIDPDAIEAAVTPRTRAILPVHLNGRTCDMDRVRLTAERHGLLIIEDAAQALGSKFNDRYAGTFGIAAAFSFYPAKILGCFGDGGAVVTNDDEVARRIRLLRDHGRNESGNVEMWGLNSRLDNLQAAILDLQFNDYQSIIDRRRHIAATYDELLRNTSELRLPPAPNTYSLHFDVYQNYEIEADRRDELREFLKQHAIGTLIQWGGKAVHQFPGLGFQVSLPRTEALFQRCLMLPMNMMVADDDVDYVCSKIREFYGE